jgi:murein DD-endopeptidase MepM/ murein hydrolase activator NlpD
MLETRYLLKLHSAGKLFLGLILAFSLLMPTHRGAAQEGESSGPVYIVQVGDSLWDIALRFRVSMADLAQANGISDPSQLAVGDRLVIPGLEGMQGVLTTGTVAFGETLHSLSRQYSLPVDTLTRLNHLTTPADLYAGSTLVLLEQESVITETQRTMVVPGQSLFELAISEGTTPWAYVLSNELAGTWDAIPGDVLHGKDQNLTGQVSAGPGALPEAITAIDLKPTPFVQGGVAVMQLKGEQSLALGGSFDERPLHFFPDGKGSYVSLQGIHAMTEPGLYTLILTGTLPAEAPYYNTPFAFSQAVLVSGGGYPFDPVLTVSPETIDPAVTRPEDAQWTALAAPATPQKLWEEVFQSPAPEIYKDCWPSLIGSRRSYNGSAYTYFHTGLDFCGGVGTEILAPAAGKVIFAGPLTVRGNAVMIDHGWGVYTGYMHMSEILVQVGDLVQPGQKIGLVGGTGRVTGPHLHWEVWAGGVQVNPMDWLEQAHP